MESLKEENNQMRRELRILQERLSEQTGSHFGADFLNELCSLADNLQELQNRLTANSSNDSVQRSINHVDVDTLNDDISRISRLLHNILKYDGTQLSSLRQGSRTVGSSSNSLTDSITTPLVEDLINLPGPVTEHAISRALHQQVAFGNNMVKLGPVLLSVNTYAPHTHQGVLQSPQDRKCLQNIVKQVLREMSDTSHPQVFVMSGCNGSGKSWLSHALVRQIMEESEGGLDTDICKHFLASYTVLQSLGCSKTASNSNSTRIGQLMEFYFTGGTVSKTKIQCFPLVGSRVTNPSPGERNFHIFYQLLAGITQEERAKLHLQGYAAQNLQYLNQSSLPSDSEEAVLRAKFERWRTGLAALTIKFDDVQRILAAILLLGNVQFVEGEGMELDVKGNNEIKAVAALLGVSGVSLYRGLTTKTKTLRGQVLRSLCDPEMANQNRDSLAQALYLRTVAAIARRINSFKRQSSPVINGSPHGSFESLRTPPLSPEVLDVTARVGLSDGLLKTPPQGIPNGTHIGTLVPGVSGLVSVMDMFGFENCEVNGLNQICVNLCAETIQHFYNTRIFKTTEEYCREEGLLSELDLDYIDNAACIELLTCQSAGVLTLMDKECLLAKGSQEEFLQEVRDHHSDSEWFFDPDPNSTAFGVCHYADNVVYETEGLLDKNRDTIPDDIICVFSRQNCSFGFATHLFMSDLRTTQGQAASPKGVLHRISPSQGQDSGSSPSIADLGLTTFYQDVQSKLDGLVKTLVQARPWFIRCIRGNAREEPARFDRNTVNQQLRALQVFETLQMLQSSFANHEKFQYFISRYGFLCPSRIIGHEESGAEDCKNILESVLSAGDVSMATHLFGSYALGKNYVFFSEPMKVQLELRHDKWRESAAITPQAHSMAANIKHSRPPSVPTDKELRVDTKTAEETCCLYGLDMTAPPPVPKSRLYTIQGNMKMGFPQTRIMKQDFTGGSSEVLFHKGEVVKVLSASRKRGYLIAEHKNGSNIPIPHQLMELKSSPTPSPR
ncbi:unconventional myosin-IXb isoform X2 [Nematostella vectensis]|uniref:unconventional myosin-IXb isoform X2 n=1 Tax=Nematostella vectensis TaxID=45351 RepID=UPI002076E303|nr:unconventional myosin-IXb isoform X2 [Nematostella vectensis]